MKTVFIILVLLTVAEWKKKEACKTKGRGWTRVEDDDPIIAHMLRPFTIRDPDQSTATTQTIVRKCHLLIIGAGAQTTALLDVLSNMMNWEQNKRTLNNPVHIVIVEQKSKFGPGKAYDSDEVIADHLTSNFRWEDLTIVSDWDDFDKWVSKHPELYKRENRHEAQLKLPPPRIAIGQYLEERFAELVEKCKVGYEITLINDTSAGSVSHGNGVFVIELSDGSEVHTTDIVLATGHWDSSLFGEDIVDGFFPSPWPASDLTDPETGIPKNAKVGIRGDGRNAIDAAMTLAHKHGVFNDKIPTDEEPDADGFVYKPNSTDFQIAIYSRRGHLPAVRGKTVTYECNKLEEYVEDQFNDDDDDDDDDDHADKLVSLHDFMEMLRDDLAEKQKVNQDEFENLAMRQEVPKFVDAKKFVQDMDYFMYEGRRPQQRLEKDTDDTRQSWQSEHKSLEFQSFFMGMLEYFNKHLKRFSPNDILTFETEIAPRILNYARPIPLVTAQKLLAMIKAQRLIIVVAGPKLEVEKASNNKGVRIKYQNGRRRFDHPYFIDATEQSSDIKRNPSPLVQSLFENNFIQQNILNLEEDAPARKKQKLNHGAKPIETFYASGGIKMDTKTMRVIPPDDAPPEVRPPPKAAPEGADAASVIYATGPFTYGQYALGHTLPEVVKFAEKIGLNIFRKRLKIYNTINLHAK